MRGGRAPFPPRGAEALGLALYVLIRESPTWLPTFLAFYAFLRGGARRRRIAAILWVPAVLLAFVGPLAEGREAGTTAVAILLAAVAGGLMGHWQGRIAPP